MLALIDTGFSNLRAYSNLLNYLGVHFEIIHSGRDLRNAIHHTVILPGVSTFGVLAHELHNRGFTEKLQELAQSGGKIIGTCSGMQILFNESQESDGAAGLGLINGEVKKFPYKNGSDIHIGWRKTITGEYFFVHGYYCETYEELDDVSFIDFNGVRLDRKSVV